MTQLNKIRLLLLVVIVMVYGQVVTHDFVDWDDGLHIYLNKNIVDHSFEGLLHHWEPMNPDNPLMYCPMVFTVWWSLAHLSDVQSPDLLGATLNPYIFHAANLVVHWLCACVVLEILLRLKVRGWAAAAGTLVFAVHPLQTEAVAWASAMKDLLSGLFALLCIWRYIAALESRKKKRRWNYWLSTIFCAAALLSKPSTVVLPAIVGAIGLIAYRQSWKDVARWTWPWYVMAVAATVIATRVQRFASWVGGPMWARPLIAMDSLSFYLGKLILPIGLKFDYGRNPTALLTDPALHHPLYWSWIFPLAVAVVIWRTNRRPLLLAGAIFVLGVLPVLGLKAFAYQYYTTVADRYVYLSMLGVALAVGWWMEGHRSRVAAIVAAAAIGVLGCLSFVQAQRWTDTQTLYTYALDHTKPIHDTILGQYQDDLAVPYFRRAVQANKTGDFAMGRELTGQGIAYLEKAMTFYRTAIRLGPDEPHGYDMLARDLVRLEQIPEAIDVVKTWISIEPHSELGIKEAPGRLEGMLGTLYLRNHQYPEAVVALKRSLAEHPDPDVEKTLAKAEKLAAQAAGGATRPSGGR
jgi:protein O-mannosyl-transferase